MPADGDFVGCARRYARPGIETNSDNVLLCIDDSYASSKVGSMNLRQYEYALAVAEEGSMTAAADRLRIAQPSLSQQIGAPEKHLEVQLFTRTPSGVTVTVAGRAFVHGIGPRRADRGADVAFCAEASVSKLAVVCHRRQIA